MKKEYKICGWVVATVTHLMAESAEEAQEFAENKIGMIVESVEEVAE